MKTPSLAPYMAQGEGWDEGNNNSIYKKRI